MHKVNDKDFIKIIDSLIEFADWDQDLKEGIRWIDEQSKKRSISFYEMTKIVLETKTPDEKAKDWLIRRNSNRL